MIMEYDGLLSSKPTSMLLSPDGTAFSPQVHPVLSGGCSRVNGYHNSKNILLTQTLQLLCHYIVEKFLHVINCKSSVVTLQKFWYSGYCAPLLCIFNQQTLYRDYDNDSYSTITECITLHTPMQADST